MRISPNVSRIQPSATLAVSALARELQAQGREIVDLSAGEPDFPTPHDIARAGVAAIEAGRTRYTPVAGIPPLRHAIARDLAHGRDLAVDAAGIVVGTGAKQALFNACFTLFGPGDRVLVPVPYWTSYPDIVRLARAEPVFVQGSEEHGFKVRPQDLERAADDGAAGLLLNSPGNPSGAVYTLDELRDLVAWARSRDVAIVSDEIYNRICFVAGRAPGLLDLGPLAPRDVLIGGASKNYAMTGWRIGYAYAGPEVTARISALQSHTTSNATTPAQHAALAAFEGASDADVVRMREAFRARRDLVMRTLAERLPDVRYVRPDGAFYVFFRVDQWAEEGRGGSIAFCRWLLEQAGVALVPGAAFGDDRFVRLSYAAAEDRILDGIARLADSVAGATSQAGLGA